MKKQWIVLHTPVGKDNIVIGPFADAFDAMDLIDSNFEYTTLAAYDNLLEAVTDTSKLSFEEPQKTE